MDPVIRFENVIYRYETHEGENSAVTALDDVSFRVGEGEFVAVIGHNGSGKSTLAKQINALLLPTEGKVLVCGMDTADPKELWEIRRSAGMVFQNPDNQLISSVVEEDVAFGPENLGVPREEIRKAVDSALADVGMSGFAQHSPHMLSGGQKQRIAIAGVIAMHPRIIVLDEPTAMLDPSGRREVMNTVRKLRNEEKITIVLITHFMEEAVQADRILVMDSGKIVKEGTPREVFAETEILQQIGLDVPQMTELAKILQEKGLPLPEVILTVEEMTEALCPLLQKN